jgi:hypothetical protein
MAALQKVRREELPEEGFYSADGRTPLTCTCGAGQHGEIHPGCAATRPSSSPENGDWEYLCRERGLRPKERTGSPRSAKNSRALPGIERGDAPATGLRTSPGRWTTPSPVPPRPAGSGECSTTPGEAIEKFRASCGVMDFFACRRLRITSTAVSAAPPRRLRLVLRARRFCRHALGGGPRA